MTLTTYDIALAFAEAWPLAGFIHADDRPGELGPMSPHDRALALIRAGYIKAGDPGEWGSGNAVATIYTEQRGGANDCNPPADHYGHWPVIRLHGLWWEWQNCAVGLVFADPDHPVTVAEAYRCPGCATRNHAEADACPNDPGGVSLESLDDAEADAYAADWGI